MDALKSLTAAQMRALCTSVRAAHRAHDYRTWADGKGGNDAAKVGKATKFKLGGHEFGHTHVDWELTDAGDAQMPTRPHRDSPAVPGGV